MNHFLSSRHIAASARFVLGIAGGFLAASMLIHSFFVPEEKKPEVQPPASPVPAVNNTASSTTPPPADKEPPLTPEESRKLSEQIARWNKEESDYSVLYPEERALEDQWAEISHIGYLAMKQLKQDHPEFLKAHKDELESILSTGTLCRQASLVCSLIDSEKPLARATLGEIIDDLSINGDLLSILREQVASAAAMFLLDGDLSSKVRTVKTLPELRELLRTAQPRFEEYFISRSTLLSTDESFRKAYDAQITASAYYAIWESYTRLYPVHPPARFRDFE